ncbi:MAG: tetratricopeptide repeat protein [Candidatus Zixiibacteriota bacterium]
MKKLVTLLFLLLILLLGGCSQSLYTQGRKLVAQEQYRSAVDLFYEELKLHPDNSQAWRELGFAYYKNGNLVKAEDALQQAGAIRWDARTHLYLGFVYEKTSDVGKALDAYGAALTLSPQGRTHTIINSRILALKRKQIEIEARRVIANERSIDTDTIPSNTVAVVSFDGSRLSLSMQPIALGLAEFVAADLAKVASLTVVERMQVEAVLKELKLGESGNLDPSSAPKAGRLFGSRRVITGSVWELGESSMRLDGAIVDVVDSATTVTDATEGAMKRVFEVEKEFVFQILDSLGIKLTDAERRAIREVPTDSYLAFLAYSRGLSFVDNGMYVEAQEQFGEAIAHDPGFGEAQVELQTLNSTDPTLIDAPLDQFVDIAGGAMGGGDGDGGSGQDLSTIAVNNGFTGTGADQSPDEPPLSRGSVSVKVSFDD